VEDNIYDANTPTGLPRISEENDLNPYKNALPSKSRLITESRQQKNEFELMNQSMDLTPSQISSLQDSKYSSIK
jgi:hypothetical protein